MNRILLIILIISIIGNIAGLFFAYKYFMAKRQIARVENNLNNSSQSLESMKNVLESKLSTRLLFIHHSVGKGFLFEGGLEDSLLKNGIIVNHATYGDEIGEETDFCHWLPKFKNNMDRILTFNSHPEIYYNDGRSNDIVMFKSCFPTSNIAADGSELGDPGSIEQTMANYKAVFLNLKDEFRKHPKKLFIFMTSPPQVSAHTTPDKTTRNRMFNQWLISEFVPSYQTETGLSNFKVFDLFDILADQNNILKEQYSRGRQGDSHPNEKANKEVVRNFLEHFLPIISDWEKQTQTDI